MFHKILQLLNFIRCVILCKLLVDIKVDCDFIVVWKSFCNIYHYLVISIDIKYNKLVYHFGDTKFNKIETFNGALQSKVLEVIDQYQGMTNKGNF